LQRPAIIEFVFAVGGNEDAFDFGGVFVEFKLVLIVSTRNRDFGQIEAFSEDFFHGVDIKLIFLNLEYYKLHGNAMKPWVTILCALISAVAGLFGGIELHIGVSNSYYLNNEKGQVIQIYESIFGPPDWLADVREIRDELNSLRLEKGLSKREPVLKESTGAESNQAECMSLNLEKNELIDISGVSFFETDNEIIGYFPVANKSPYRLSVYNYLATCKIECGDNNCDAKSASYGNTGKSNFLFQEPANNGTVPMPILCQVRFKKLGTNNGFVENFAITIKCSDEDNNELGNVDFAASNIPISKVLTENH
jgi:hypothetical protein